MAEFKRGLSKELIQKLQGESLFREKLMADIKEGPGNKGKKSSDWVFPAIRNDCVSFYYKGGGIFTYDNNGFSSHKKYCVVPAPDTRNYLTEAECGNVETVKSFAEGYEQIKERCQKYGGVEAERISDLYKCSGVNGGSILLLDVEVCFDGRDLELEEADRRRTNRIDLLFYNTRKQELCFCEAKDFSNGELWAVAGKKPAVCKQLARYDQIIEKNRKNILGQYQEYVRAFNQLFGTQLSEPQSLYPRTGLLIFGFDSKQKAKIKELLIQDGSLSGINYDYRQKTAGEIENIYKHIAK